MKTISLCTDVAAAATGSETRLQLDDGSTGRDELVAQVAISTGAATVAIQGRLSPLLPWATLTTVTAAGFLSIVRVPYLRVVISGVSGNAVVNVAVFA